ncbi:type I secretion system permease/ATPase [Pelagibaculum spongiae]|uniref:Type I secretion system permease/ATPase n=1 Tax=Pelagibaculum spongiae TaxID=2080658 RepID=A0A2V1GZJ1_9GAMM|nr:type I secretion system permease/ATPase [Pelagibaculum spongiae]PVZ68792.1 type I secretion system permease/ATPase [Pelagibaculum spongiae]
MASSIKEQNSIPPASASESANTAALQFVEIVSEATRLLGRPLSPQAILSSLCSDATLEKGIDVAGVNDSLEKGGLTCDQQPLTFDQAKQYSGVAVCLLTLSGGKKVSVLLASGQQQATEQLTQAFLVKDGKLASIAWESIEKFWQGQVLQIGVKSLAKNEKEAVGKKWLRQVLWKELPSYGYVWMAALVINIFALVLPLFNLAVYDRVAPNGAINTLWTLAIGVFIILIFDFVMKEIRSYLVDTAARRVDVKVSRQIYEHLLGLKMEHRMGAAGSIADVLRGFSSVQEFFSSATLIVLIDLPFVVLFITLMFVIGGPLGLVPLVAGPLALLVGLLLQGPLSRASKQAAVNGQDRQGTLVETITNLEMVRAVGAERVMRGRWQDQVHASAISGMKVRMYGQLASHSAALLQQISSVSLIIGGVYLISSGDMTMGALIAVNMLGGRAMQPFTQTAGLLSRSYHARVAFDQISEFMDRPQLRSQDASFLSRKDLGKSFQIKAADFHYPAEQPVPALQPSSLDIKEGERVAIIGKIGSGKSTLLKLLAGIYSPQNGSVQIGGVDSRQILPAELRAHVGYVGQDPMLFSGSLKENICIGQPEASDQAILHASRMAGVEQFVSQHPDGYQRVLGERGAGLSNGQKQAVAIAQALLHQPNILLLDEPTSAMDPTTERQLLHRLRDLIQQKNLTVVLVTHTPALLELVDRLVVMEHGRILLDGEKSEVLARLKGGIQEQPIVDDKIVAQSQAKIQSGVAP